MVHEVLPGVGAAVVGGFLWKKHRTLGVLAGVTLGSNAYDLARGDRREALCNVGVGAAAIGSSLAWKKHPIFGWILGSLAASAVASVIPGSYQNKLLKQIESDEKAAKK